ncbi:MAG: ABC transporter substrate-binding protein [Thermoproteota archaeon]
MSARSVDFKKYAYAVVLALLTIISITPLTIPALAQEVPNGGWLDEIVFFKESDASKMFDMIEKGEAHEWQWAAPVTLIDRIKASDKVRYVTSSGVFYLLDVNPCQFRSGFNPFVNAKMREALNYIVDREYLAYTVMKGAGRPKYTILVSGFPDYGQVIDVAKMIESKYRFNLDNAKEIIYKEMADMGAVLKDGKWYYEDKLVTIKFIIRTEDARRDIGDFIASQLEKLGFTVDRQYKPASEAFPIRYGGDLRDGLWHLYTGGYEAGFDQSGDFWGFFAGAYIEQGAVHDPVFSEIARRLSTADYSSLEEKISLMKKALLMSVEDSTYVGLVDRLSIFMVSKDLTAAYHLSAGPWRMPWSRTVRLKDRVGGTIKVGEQDLLVEEMNPVALGGWVWDAAVYMPTQDYGFIESPYTVALIPLRVKEYSVEVAQGIAIKQTPQVKTVDRISVPSDAIASWDVVSKKYVNVGENKYAKAKVTLVYDSPLGKYHDGTDITLADFMFWFALGFERTSSSSKIYDESAVPGFIATMKQFIGFKLISSNPVKVEVYVNMTHVEPTRLADWAAQRFTLSGFPYFPWHDLAVAVLARQDGKLGFSALEAKSLGCERVNFMYGPSMAILNEYLDKAIKEKYVPEWIKDYVTPDEAVARYQKLKEFYNKYKHFWVGCGPYYLYSTDPVGKVAVLRAFREYVYKADKFDWLLKSSTPEASLKVPEKIVPGIEAKINVTVSSMGEPYPRSNIEKVMYLVTDPAGNMLLSGIASETAIEGLYQIRLNETETSKLPPGTHTVTVYAFSNVVAVPGSGEATMAVIPPASYIALELNRVRQEMEARLSALEALNSQISNLSSEVNSLKNTLNLAVGVGVVAIIIAIVAMVLSIRKKQ